MANARALDRRRRSVRNIRKITRTMELIATARFKKAMDRSVAARDYTQQLAKILQNIANRFILRRILVIFEISKYYVIFLKTSRFRNIIEIF